MIIYQSKIKYQYPLSQSLSKLILNFTWLLSIIVNYLIGDFCQIAKKHLFILYLLINPVSRWEKLMSYCSLQIQVIDLDVYIVKMPKISNLFLSRREKFKILSSTLLYCLLKSRIIQQKIVFILMHKIC